MTKPHEEEWELGQYTALRVVESVEAVTNTLERRILAAAAPDMARALLEIRDAINSGTLSLDDLQSVVERPLRKAGVL